MSWIAMILYCYVITVLSVETKEFLGDSCCVSLQLCQGWVVVVLRRKLTVRNAKNCNIRPLPPLTYFLTLSFICITSTSGVLQFWGNIKKYVYSNFIYFSMINPFNTYFHSLFSSMFCHVITAPPQTSCMRLQPIMMDNMKHNYQLLK